MTGTTIINENGKRGFSFGCKSCICNNHCKNCFYAALLTKRNLTMAVNVICNIEIATQVCTIVCTELLENHVKNVKARLKNLALTFCPQIYTSYRVWEKYAKKTDGKDTAKILIAVLAEFLKTYGILEIFDELYETNIVQEVQKLANELTE